MARAGNPPHHRAMRSLYFISASLLRLPRDEVRQAIAGFFRSRAAADTVPPVVICPDGAELPDLAMDARRYGAAIGMESSRDLWRPLMAQPFDRVLVMGSAALLDREEIAIACFIPAAKKTYYDANGGTQDIASWERDIRPDFRPRPVRITPLAKADQQNYIRGVHQWLAAELMAADFGKPMAFGVADPAVSLYTQYRLARDLAQLTNGLQIEAHDAPFSRLIALDGSIVQSPDFHRAIANFVLSINGVHDVLEVGCGSGFLSCYLAASGRYARVLGTDFSPTRIDSARLHAELAGSTASFAEMSMARLDVPDQSFDLTVTSFALEQSGRELGAVLAELRRVTRKFIVLCEPTAEYVPTVPSIWHVQRHGWANSYSADLAGLNYAVRPNVLRQYYTPGAIFVIDLQRSENPVIALPQLFRPLMADWPGGVEIEAL